jgi:hypothetical protein
MTSALPGFLFLEKAALRPGGHQLSSFDIHINGLATSRLCHVMETLFALSCGAVTMVTSISPSLLSNYDLQVHNLIS